MKTVSNKVDRTAHKLRLSEVITLPRYGYDVRLTWTCLDCGRSMRTEYELKAHTERCRSSAFRRSKP